MITDSWRSFEPLMERLPPSWSVIAPSLRGHGQSDRPETGYRAADMARDLDLLLGALGIEQALVVGHSMGGGVALRLALDFPSRTRALMLIGAAATWKDIEHLPPLLREIEGSGDVMDPAFVRAFQESTLARAVPPAFLDMAVRESLEVPARTWRELFRALMLEDATPELGRVHVPVLMLCGEQDQLASEQQPVLLSGLPAARLIVPEGHGHALHWEDPVRVAALLTAFVAGMGEGDAVG